MIGSVVGGVVSHYELLGLIGKGSTGAVYKARDTRLNRLVALKFLSPGLLDSPDARARFESEARTIASLSHNNIGVLYDVGETEGTPYLVLEYLGGGTLASRVRDRQLPLAEILAYARQIADGLSHAHNHGILHRDIKPGNALFAESGALKLVDFGLAHRQPLGGFAESAQPGGTPAYMAPEAVFSGVIDQRSDIFAFGVLLYQLAAGRLPFQAEHTEDVFRQIRQEAPPPLPVHRPDLPPAYIDLVQRCLSKDPDARPHSMAVIRQELDLMEWPGSPSPFPSPESPTLTAPGRRTGPITRISRRARRWLMGSLALAALALVLWLIAGWDPTGRTEPDSRKCVVVLPFVCRDTGPESAGLCRGLDVELTNILLRSQHIQAKFWTVAPSEVAARDVKTVREARDSLNADFTIGGAVIRSPAGYTIHVDLSEAGTGRFLDTRHFSVTAAELLALPAGFLNATLEMLGTAAPASSVYSLAAAPTSNPQAWQLCIQAQGILIQYSGQEKAAEAIGLLDRAIGLDPRNPVAYALAAQAWLQRHDAERDPSYIGRAAAAADTAAKLDTRDYQVLLSVGKVRLRQQRYLDAAGAFTRAAALNRGDPEPLRLLAIARTGANEPARALEAYRQAIALNPSFWPTWQNRALFYRNRGELDKAMEDMRMAAKLSPANPDVHRDLGIYATEIGRFDEAEKHFDQSLRLKRTMRALNAYGHLRDRQGRLEEAVSYFRDAAALAPNNLTLFYNLGETLHSISGRESEARDAWRRCSALLGSNRAVNATSPSVLSHGAVCEARLGNLAAARGAAADAAKLSPRDRGVLLDAAVVAALQKDRSRTLALLEQAVRAGAKPKEILTNPDFEIVSGDPQMRKRIAVLESNINKQ